MLTSSDTAQELNFALKCPSLKTGQKVPLYREVLHNNGQLDMDAHHSTSCNVGHMLIVIMITSALEDNYMYPIIHLE